MTKHELLDYIYNSGTVTRHEIMDQFNLAYGTVNITINALRLRGLIRFVGINKQSGHHEFEITEIGIKKLEYFNENECKNRSCSCYQNHRKK